MRRFLITIQFILAFIVAVAGTAPADALSDGSGSSANQITAGSFNGGGLAGSGVSGLNGAPSGGSGMTSGGSDGSGLGMGFSGALPPGATLPPEVTPEKLRQYLQSNQPQLRGPTGFPAAKLDQTGTLVLKAEAGDSMVSLRWRISGLSSKAALDLQFALLVGTEPGRYARRMEIGTDTDYVLRELKNNQSYFIKILGYTRDGAISLSSNEERVIPLPAESLGSPLESSFARETATMQDKVEADPFNRKLKQFGYDFFKNSVASGLPNDKLPVGPDYTFGPGDVINIDLWGSISVRHELEVSKDGEISIPRVGVIKVSGLKYAQVKDVINRAISHYFKDYQLNVTAGNLRTIQLFVVGEVMSPGTYTISALSTVINALAMAGGPSKSGSLRNIKLQREGRTVQEIDLYDMFLGGDRSKDFRLENGDTIFVPIIGPVAAIGGEVKRPAIYELEGKTTFDQLLQMSGGITAAGDTGRIQIERFEGNASRVPWIWKWTAKGRRTASPRRRSMTATC